MSNIIQITACDNELIVIAFGWDISYQICNIKSGNNQPVNVNINITNGVYLGSQDLNGVNNKLDETVVVSIPSGKYELVVAGINWGAETNFEIALNGISFSPISDSKTQEKGVVWTPTIKELIV